MDLQSNTLSRVRKHNRNTKASLYNRQILNSLSRALRDDPEADLLSAMPSNYTATLKVLQTGPTNKTPGLPPLPRDTRSILRESKDAVVVSTLSSEIRGLLHGKGTLLQDINDLLAQSEILFQYPHGHSTLILRASKGIVVKIVRDIDNHTEHTSLRYLEKHLPGIPAPRPHGAVKIDRLCLLFMSFIPGTSLDKVWPQLEDSHKQEIKGQLGSFMRDLRSLPFPTDQPLGGVQGEGCKDGRRNIRFSKQRIRTAAEFEDFVFSTTTSKVSPYEGFLRALAPATTMCVFTHGDLRPANIQVEQDNDGNWKITGILDWEFSGFYPEYWESVKTTNNLSPFEKSDWYFYLPTCVSPALHVTRWLLDRVWDQYIS